MAETETVARVARPAPFLTAVVTCYFEERSIDEFYGRLRAALERTGRSFELVMVNDGSTDGTLDKLRAIHARDPGVTVVDLFKNAGQTCAMAAGVERGRGENFLFIDSDLQLEPEDLPSLLVEFERGFDVVSGARRDRKDPLARRLPSWLANVIMRRMTGAPFTDFGCTFKLYRGALLRAFDLGPRRPMSLYVLRSAGRVKEVPVTHHPRRYGRSGWTFIKLFRFNLDNTIGASEGLFQQLSLLAGLVALLTLARIAYAFVAPGSVLLQPPTTGLLLNAMLLSTAGLLAVVAFVGELVVRLHKAEHAGPLYIVREVLPARD